MANLFVFPDLEAVAVAFLKAEFADLDIEATVATKVPNPAPARMVRVSGLGGSRRNVVAEDAGLLLECWAPNEVSASELARTVRAIVDGMDGQVPGAWIERVGTSTPVPFPDPDSNSPRYQFTAQITSVGEVLQ